MSAYANPRQRAVLARAGWDQASLTGRTWIDPETGVETSTSIALRRILKRARFDYCETLDSAAFQLAQAAAEALGLDPVIPCEAA